MKKILFIFFLVLKSNLIFAADNSSIDYILSFFMDRRPGSTDVFFEKHPTKEGLFIVKLRSNHHSLDAGEHGQQDPQGDMTGPFHLLSFSPKLRDFLGFQQEIIDGVSYWVYPSPEYFFNALEKLGVKRFKKVDGIINEAEYLEILSKGLWPIATEEPERGSMRFHAYIHDINNHIISLFLPEDWVQYAARRANILYELHKFVHNKFPNEPKLKPLFYALSRQISSLDISQGSTGNFLIQRIKNPNKTFKYSFDRSFTHSPEMRLVYFLQEENNTNPSEDTIEIKISDYLRILKRSCSWTQDTEICKSFENFFKDLDSKIENLSLTLDLQNGLEIVITEEQKRLESQIPALENEAQETNGKEEKEEEEKKLGSFEWSLIEYLSNNPHALDNPNWVATLPRNFLRFLGFSPFFANRVYKY